MTSLAQSVTTINPATLPITDAHFAQAVRQLRLERQRETGAIDRLNKAYVELLGCSPATPGVMGRDCWQWDGEALVMPSRTTPGVRYHVQYNGCSCKAGVHGRACWHADALTLVRRAAEYALPAVAVTPKRVYTEADFDDCF